MMKKIFNHKKAVLAFLLALVMVVGLVPFTATEVQAQEIDVNATMEGANFEDGQVMTVAIQSRTNGVWKSDFFKYTYQGGEWVSNNPMKVSDFNVLENICMYIGYSNLNGRELNECLNYDQYMTDESNLICDQSAGFLNFDWMVPTEEITLPTAENPVITSNTGAATTF